MKLPYESPRLQALIFAQEDLLNLSGDPPIDPGDPNEPSNPIELPKIDF